MGRQQHFAGMHLIRWNRFEPAYRWEELRPVKKEPEKKATNENQEKAPMTTGITIYDKRTGRTATISGHTNIAVTYVFDDGIEVKSCAYKKWVKDVPLSSTKDYPPIYAKVGELQSYICVRFGNIVETVGVEGYVSPFVASDKSAEQITFIEKEGPVIDEFNQNKVIEKKRYQLCMPISLADKEDAGNAFFSRCLDEFMAKDVNYISLPYIYDLCKYKNKADIATIAFEAVSSWMKRNPGYAMQVVFLCTNISEYIEYKALLGSESEI